MARPEKHVFVCTHSRPEDDPKGSCAQKGSGSLASAFADQIGDRNLWGKIKLNTSSCMGVCEHGPAVLVYPEGTMYGKVTTDDVVRIIDQHLLNGEPIDELKMPADVWE
jgi:(2Fe-2S) ferredoxin|tara:strand:- start:298 stop:624 length:327 start_codon:yes stop_codon:yes gene_type:complete